MIRDKAVASKSLLRGIIMKKMESKSDNDFHFNLS